MPNNELNTLVLRRFEYAQTLIGRFALNLNVEYQRLHASWLSGGGAALKRGLDIFASGSALIVLSPLFAIIAILVKLEDGGPIFFRQIRVGRFGREFTMYKMRSMCLDAEQRLKEILEKNDHKEGVTFKLKDDPRITRVGKWLRKFSLDELPQLYNVFAAGSR
jgi:lipopolysaccharide/colanic/teichoic acid biosynthesis glycosyltransferase